MSKHKYNVYDSPHFKKSNKELDEEKLQELYEKIYNKAFPDKIPNTDNIRFYFGKYNSQIKPYIIKKDDYTDELICIITEKCIEDNDYFVPLLELAVCAYCKNRDYKFTNGKPVNHRTIVFKDIASDIGLKYEEPYPGYLINPSVSLIWDKFFMETGTVPVIEKEIIKENTKNNKKAVKKSKDNSKNAFENALVSEHEFKLHCPKCKKFIYLKTPINLICGDCFVRMMEEY